MATALTSPHPASLALRWAALCRAAWQALSDAWRRHAEQAARRRLVRDTMRELQHLDARTLRDLGLDASELLSAAHESARLADGTRLHVLGRFTGA